MIQTDDFSDKASFLYPSSQMEWGQAEDQRPWCIMGEPSAGDGATGPGC